MIERLETKLAGLEEAFSEPETHSLVNQLQDDIESMSSTLDSLENMVSRVDLFENRVSKVDSMENELRTSLQIIHRNNNENKKDKQNLSSKLMDLEETRGKDKKELYIQLEKLHNEIKSNTKDIGDKKAHNIHIEEKTNALSAKHESLQRQIL